MILPNLNSLTELVLGEILSHKGFVTSEVTLRVFVTILETWRCLWFGTLLPLPPSGTLIL